MLGTYFGFLMRFTTKEYTSGWDEFEVGIAKECSVSSVLFVLAVQLLEATVSNAGVVELGGGFRIPTGRAFMDDAAILSSRESTTRKIQGLMDR